MPEDPSGFIFWRQNLIFTTAYASPSRKISFLFRVSPTAQRSMLRLFGRPYLQIAGGGKIPAAGTNSGWGGYFGHYRAKGGGGDQAGNAAVIAGLLASLEYSIQGFHGGVYAGCVAPLASHYYSLWRSMGAYSSLCALDSLQFGIYCGRPSEPSEFRFVFLCVTSVFTTR